MVVDQELIEELYECDKVVRDEVAWETDPDVDHEYYSFEREAFAPSIDQLLRWFGWFQVQHGGERRWGFKLEFQNKYTVRTWDMAKQHYSSEQDEWFRGQGEHKHYYESEGNPRAIYEIPDDEISTEDPNQAVLDFCDECNIHLEGGYQPRIFPV